MNLLGSTGPMYSASAAETRTPESSSTPSPSSRPQLGEPSTLTRTRRSATIGYNMRLVHGGQATGGQPAGIGLQRAGNQALRRAMAVSRSLPERSNRAAFG